MSCDCLVTSDEESSQKGGGDTGNGLVVATEIETDLIDALWPHALVSARRHWPIHEPVGELFILGRACGSKLVAVSCVMNVPFPGASKWHAASFVPYLYILLKYSP